MRTPGQRRPWLLLLAVLVVLLTAGCQLPQQGKSVSVKQTLKKPSQVKIAVVTHGAPGDQFWDFVRSGVDQAEKDYKVSVHYTSSPDPGDQATLIDNAVADGANGLVVSMANPDALRASIRKAVAKGIPVVTINSGIDDWKAFGAFTHVGQSEPIAGAAAGAQMKKAGLKHAICVIHEAGNIGLEQRCKAAAKAFGGQMTNLQVDGTDTTSASSTMTSKLRADKSVDGVLALNGQIASLAVGSASDAGSKAKVATFDTDKNVLSDIIAGKLLFAVDQQPYLQGYEGVAAVVLKLTRGVAIGGGQPVYTGPTIIDKSNAKTALAALTGAGS